MSTQPSLGALRAASRWIQYSGPGTDQQRAKLAVVIDREAMQPAVMEATSELLAALKRAEVQLAARWQDNLSRPLRAHSITRDESLGDDLFAVRAAIARAEAIT